MPKVIETQNGWMIQCHACQWHEFPKNQLQNGASWTFNNNLDQPTFTPSMNQTTNLAEWTDYNPECPSSRCHFIVTKGNIHYCSDCTHKWAGQTLTLEEWDESKVKYYQILKETEKW